MVRAMCGVVRLYVRRPAATTPGGVQGGTAVYCTVATSEDGEEERPATYSSYDRMRTKMKQNFGARADTPVAA